MILLVKMRPENVFTSLLSLCGLLVLRAEAQIQCDGNNTPAIIPRDCASALGQFYQSSDKRIVYPFRIYSRTSGSCQVTINTQNAGYINVDGYSTSSGLTELNKQCSGTGSVVIPHGSTKGGGGNSVLVQVDHPSTSQVA